ncbi:hypothetical protein FRC08_007059, partial [Ceratobasidium sp. 394]
AGLVALVRPTRRLSAAAAHPPPTRPPRAGRPRVLPHLAHGRLAARLLATAPLTRPLPRAISPVATAAYRRVAFPHAHTRAPLPPCLPRIPSRQSRTTNLPTLVSPTYSRRLVSALLHLVLAFL